MHTRDTLFHLEGMAEDMKTIILYLAISPNHRVERPFGLMTQRLSLDHKAKNLRFILTSTIDPGDIPAISNFDPSFRDFAAFKQAATTQKPSPDYADTFKNKWQEIKSVTHLTMSANRIDKLL